MNKFHIQLVTIVLFMSCSPPTTDEILLEEFDNNTMGWAQESTDSHHTEFIDGKLLILSLDTVASMSSNGPEDNSFMWTLPENFEFSTSIELIDGGTEAKFGFSLYSASLLYDFSISKSGLINVYERDYNRESVLDLIEIQLNEFTLDYNTPLIFRLVVNGTNFQFFVDESKVGEGVFKAKSWETLRPYANAGGTGIKVDYYRFKAI